MHHSNQIAYGSNTHLHLLNYYPVSFDPCHPHSNLLRAFKSGIKPAMNDIYKMLLYWCQRHITQATVIMAVPSSDHRKINAITKVAQALAKKLPHLTDATQAITKLHSTASFCRGKNRSAETIIQSLHIDATAIYGQHILLLDDITTTGTTFSTVQQMLLDAGAASVTCLALGKVPKLR